MKFVPKKLSVASLGITDFSLPILSVGSGGPRVLIINNLHGNELTGYFVLEKIKSSLLDLRGTINIVVSANPFGLIHKQRFLPFDNVDPNRGYPNPPQARGLSSALRDKLINLAMQHDIIIDLHTFMLPCLSAGLFIPQSNKDHDALIEKSLNVSNTDITIKINTNTNEKRIESALGIHLIKQKKMFLVLEYNPIRQIGTDDEKIKIFSDGLLNIFSVLGLINKKVATKNKIMVERQQVISLESGLFIPAKKLGENINTGEVIGFLINPKTLDKKTVISNFSGLITELADRQFFLFGDKLATIGKKVV